MPDALVFLESPHRIRATLADIASISQRRVMIGREMTKQYESFIVGSAHDVLAQLADAPKGEFVCIVDHTKWVSNLGEFPLPIEVIPTSIKYVSKEIKEMGGDPEHRKGVITDNGNLIIDVKGLYPISKPKSLEKELNNIAGVVTNGIFALRPADKIFVASNSEVSEYSRPLASS